MSIVRIVSATAAAVCLAAAAAAAPAPGSQLIDCSQADSVVEMSVSSHLDPSCTWTRGVRIHTSNVVLDCQGAHIDPQNAIVGGVNDTTDHETIAAIAGGAAGVSIVPIRTSVPRPTRRRAALATVWLQWSAPGSGSCRRVPPKYLMFQRGEEAGARI